MYIYIARTITKVVLLVKIAFYTLMHITSPECDWRNQKKDVKCLVYPNIQKDCDITKRDR